MADPKQNEVEPKGFPLTEQQLEELNKTWGGIAVQSEAIQKAEPLDVGSLEQPQPNLKKELLLEQLNKLLTQRNDQRKKIFELAKWYCWTSLVFLIAIVCVQAAGRIAGPELNFSIFDGNELEVIVIGVFGQFVGLLYIITRSLYDDKNYKDLFRDGMGRD